MRYIVFWEYAPGDLDKVIEKRKQIIEERKKDPKKYPKTVFGPYGIGGEGKGFTVCETNDPKQLVNYVLHYTPVMTMKFSPIFETGMVIELREKMKK